MLDRCENPERTGWARYGGRGIKVCERWHDPLLYMQDIDALLGPCPKGMTLDRIDNDGDYEPDNVQWATWSWQSRNQRSVRANVPKGAIYVPREAVWVAKIQLGTFATPEEAGAAYARAADVLRQAGLL